jgi:hypothetical protein
MRQDTARNVGIQGLSLGCLAFAAAWIATSHFDDLFARLVLAGALASWVAVSSGITGFILLQTEALPLPQRWPK